MTHELSEQISDEMRECIRRCSDCHDVCVETVTHCLTRGGEHAAAEHILTLLDCAQVCATSRDLILRGSRLHTQSCALCAEACERCAGSCENHPDSGERLIRRCAEECRRCAESCRAMAA